MRWIPAISFLLLLPSLASGQEIKCRYVSQLNTEFVLDSLTILPSTLKITDQSDVTITYNPNTGTVFLSTSEAVDSVEICYQALPFAIHKTYMRRDIAEISSEEFYQQADTMPRQANLAGQREELFHTENLYKSGSLSRSVSFGNAQDVVVNSQLNLQLEGKLTDDINMRASITDQNVPYQPEGNTAQIQEFDNVFIQFYNDNFDFIAGDVVLQDNKQSHFLKYYKNVQGGLLGLNYKIGENGHAKTSFGASVAKGKFASIVIPVAEGVAGPYRIEIPDASRLAIIMANSERVFLDGKQLQRGFDYDYVIDYDKAEITFTTRVLITQYSRVRIDVEYSDQNYGRSILAFNHTQQHKRVDFFVNYYSEKDNRNNPLTFNLSDQDKQLLASIGDDLESAFKEGSELADFNPQRVQYEQIDTLTSDLQTVQIFRYSRNSGAELFDVTFTEVNMGEGDYIRRSDLINGVVFQWVSPEDGIRQGNYVPARKIVTPTQKNMADAGIAVKVSSHETVFAEGALSTNDVNLYSDLDANDDNDYAYIAGIRSENRKLSNKLKMTSGLSFEKNGRYFNPIDRFRYIEFDRDWNYRASDFAQAMEENIFKANIGVMQDADNSLAYELVRRKRGEAIDGAQHVLALNKGLGNIFLKSDAFLMQNRSVDFLASWNRLNAELLHRGKIFVPGYKFSIDRNEIRDAETDSVRSTEMNFYEHTVYVQNNDTLKTRFRMDYSYREDQLPRLGEMALANIAHTANFRVNHDAQNNRLETIITYRNSENLFAGNGENEETINTRVDWYATFFKDHVRSDLSYTTGSGRELRREFIFIEVLAGQGTHTWRDDNNNGIQELNEFYIAVNPDEKNYAKIFVPTNDFIFAHSNNFNYRFNGDMPRNWAQASGLKRFLSRFSNITSLTTQRKITDQSLAARFLPFGPDVAEEDLVSSRSSLNSRMFFNRRDPRYGVEAGYSQLENKQFLAGGFEKRYSQNWSLNFRSNIWQEFSIGLQVAEGSVANASDFLEGKTYELSTRELKPQVAWQPNVHFRVSGEYSYRAKTVLKSEEDEHSRIHEGAVSVIYNKATKMSVNSQFKVSNIDFRGRENSPVGYELLEALRPGQNYTWNIVFQKKLFAGLQLSLNYEGRKSADYKVIHIGRMQVSVLF